MKTLHRFALAAVALALSAHAAAMTELMTPDQALREGRQGKPYAGMPDLNKPVFAKPYSLICQKRGGLAISNIEVVLLTRSCFAREEATRVELLLPTDRALAMECRMYGYIPVLVRAKAMSDASAVAGWVFIEDLTN